MVILLVTMALDPPAIHHEVHPLLMIAQMEAAASDPKTIRHSCAVAPFLEYETELGYMVHIRYVVSIKMTDLRWLLIVPP